MRKIIATKPELVAYAKIRNSHMVRSGYVQLFNTPNGAIVVTNLDGAKQSVFDPLRLEAVQDFEAWVNVYCQGKFKFIDIHAKKDSNCPPQGRPYETNTLWDDDDLEYYND